MKAPKLTSAHMFSPKIYQIPQVRLMHGLQRSWRQEMVLHKNIQQLSVAPRSYWKEGILGLLRRRLSWEGCGLLQWYRRSGLQMYSCRWGVQVCSLSGSKTLVWWEIVHHHCLSGKKFHKDILWKLLYKSRTIRLVHLSVNTAILLWIREQTTPQQNLIQAAKVTRHVLGTMRSAACDIQLQPQLQPRSSLARRKRPIG